MHDIFLPKLVPLKLMFQYKIPVFVELQGGALSTFFSNKLISALSFIQRLITHDDKVPANLFIQPQAF